MTSVALVGTLDTKGEEYRFLSERLRAGGCTPLLVDCGVLGTPTVRPDVERGDVAAAAGADVQVLAATGDRGEAMAVMARGAAVLVRRLVDEGRVDGVLAAGGSNAATILAAVAADLPVGVPKVVVSTIAAFDTRPYVAATDVTLMYPVVDVSGLNRVTRQVLANAAAAVAGMVSAPPVPTASADRPLIGLTAFGVTTAGATVLRERLDELGYEVLTFHATGVGGQSMETLVRTGSLAGVADLTTTELADELCGGICSAGADRLRAAGSLGLPQVVSLGALDMVNFGPRETVPDRYRDRLLVAHNTSVTLMRTDAAECAELGRRVADRLNEARGPVTLFVPERGVSQISTAGGVFADPEADAALFDAVTGNVAPHVDVVTMDADVNDPAFATAMADTLHRLMTRTPLKEFA